MHVKERTVTDHMERPSLPLFRPSGAYAFNLGRFGPNERVFILLEALERHQ